MVLFPRGPAPVRRASDDDVVDQSELVVELLAGKLNEEALEALEAFKRSIQEVNAEALERLAQRLKQSSWWRCGGSSNNAVTQTCVVRSMKFAALPRPARMCCRRC